MSTRTIDARAALAVLLLALWAAPCAFAQEIGDPPPTPMRVAVDTVVSSDLSIDHEERNSRAVVDLFGGWRLAEGLDVIGRPLLRRDRDGEWHADLYQLAIRYGGGKDVRWRLEGGYLPSPIGISPLESRADANPLIAPITAYTSRLPPFEGGTPRTQLSSPLYPLAAQVTLSTAKWDARLAVLESSLARVRPLTGDDGPPRAPQLALGGGITPRVGLRVGGSMAHGRYARAREVADATSGDRMATTVGADADWAFGYTRVYGDFVRMAFDRAIGTAVATAVTVTAVRNLSPRWYLAARAQRLSTSHIVEAVETPLYAHPGGAGYGGSYGDGSPYGHQHVDEWIDRGSGRALSLETALGYRLTRELTLRTGYLGYRGFDDAALEHHATCSIVWSKRWW
jgi:hypothetical protein